ncbi:protein kinase domain-containing protein [Alienimonas californiensis]|uniref:Serine/threonine-protein kinase PknB n=1 Tax=Alienimonas californiensis TaxID=2527989 RepID=A0A517P9C8_9PLAN|nr:protein kinase [Alienimonas californiensis]QDT15980.1 Serine/threonine-protein kinase PknB [Alienimonas californiensis]
MPPQPLPATVSGNADQTQLDSGQFVRRRFGRYELLRTLGRGAMGTVYLARDRRLHRNVALKTPAPSIVDDPRLRTRFLHEARAAATLQHPNLCPVYDAGEIDGWPYLTMALLPGPDLAAARPGPQPAREAARLIRDLSDGMAHAHSHGIVHRDLKPANVLMNAAGQPAVTDFGLARRVTAARENDTVTDAAGERTGSPGTASDDLVTAPGSILGTPSYMAPEQIGGDRREVGPRSDVYSLGVIFYELLTGHRPFEGKSTAEVMRQVLTGTPVPLRERRPDVDPALDEIWQRMTAWDAADRFGSMAEVRDALNAFLNRNEPSGGDEPTIPAGPPNAPPAPATSVDRSASALPAPNAGRRSTALWAAAIAGAFLLLGVVTIVYRAADGSLQTMTVDVPGDVAEVRVGQPSDPSPPGGDPARPDAPSPAGAAAADEDAGWEELFNGEDLTGWATGDDDAWEVLDGVLHARFPADDESLLSELRTQRAFGDGEFRVAARLEGAVGSGVTVRNPSGRGGRATEVNFAPADAGWHGSLWSKVWDGENSEGRPPESIRVTPETAKAADAAAAGNGLPAGWHVLDIRTEGETVSVRVNGVPTASADLDDLPARGALGLLLQRRSPGNVGSMAFRSVRWRPLPPAAAPTER